MSKGEDREHIPTVASSFGTFLHLLGNQEPQIDIDWKTIREQFARVRVPKARALGPWSARVRAAITVRRVVLVAVLFGGSLWLALTL